ncbi:MAG: hypothetical protein PHP28_13540 [Actinomycetota bacterium]|nr:hypothetical protein [Actinomycetota bacterium]MDD5667863.1 hypothetical protein [Actinomycetota bacterium]
MKRFIKALFSTGIWTLAAAVAVITAIGTVATLGVARNVDAKVESVHGLVVRSNELNESMRVSLDPTIELNEQAGVVGGYIRDTLQAMAEMREGLVAMVAAIEANNGVLALVRTHTDKLTVSLGALVPYIEELAAAVEEGNVASATALGTLEKINGLNDAIAAEMAQMRDKIANSVSYRIIFTLALPVLP